MSSNQDILEYLKTKTFIPHENGNYARYGLNLFGCDSVIQYDNKIWKFKYFITNTNNISLIQKSIEVKENLRLWSEIRNVK